MAREALTLVGSGAAARSPHPVPRPVLARVVVDGRRRRHPCWTVRVGWLASNTTDRPTLQQEHLILMVLCSTGQEIEFKALELIGMN